MNLIKSILRIFMAKKTKKVAVEAEIQAMPSIKEELAFAKDRLAHFLELRKDVVMSKEWHEYDFWVNHWKQVIENLEKK